MSGKIDEGTRDKCWGLPKPAPRRSLAAWAARRPPGRLESVTVTEEALMAAYCDGDGCAFERLFGILGPRLHGFFMRSFNSAAIADDLTQTTFLRVHRARAEYRRELPVRPWVFTIAARVRVDELRRQRRRAEDADDEALATDDGAPASADMPEAAVATRQLVARVRGALDQLPESQRVIVHLHRYEELTFVEIARVLGTTEGAVKLRAFRAYERLRKLLRSSVAHGGDS
jgi:RNA polymerase sigma-70 factor (ECF subfamily)